MRKQVVHFPALTWQVKATLNILDQEMPHKLPTVCLDNIALCKLCTGFLSSIGAGRISFAKRHKSLSLSVHSDLLDS